jgi:hypothetical protein
VVPFPCSLGRPARAFAAAGAALSTWLLVASGGCSRQTELRGEADAGSGINAQNLPEAGALPEIPDTGLDDPSRMACAKRPTGNCVGANDFPCDFSRWVTQAANDCQTATDCKADGWVGAQMTEEGCVSSLHMEEPEDAFVACMVEALGPFRCPCGEGFAAAYLGLDNDGCFHGCSDELPCTSGYRCISGFCVEQ